MAERPPERQTLEPRQAIPRHRHDEAYVALVLTGGYEEAGESGRRRLAPGEAAVHEAFAGHHNSIGAGGAVVLNLPAAGLFGGFGQVADPDAVVRLAETDPRAAARLLAESFAPLPAQTLDWPDELARVLISDPQLTLADWADRQGLAAETLSRGFQRVFGLTPKRFRHEQRARRALRGLSSGGPSLAVLALDSGFADQAHMTHAVTALTGLSPGAWRRASSGDKTGG